jgi:tetratricopeptide (TPR) repeat protein
LADAYGNAGNRPKQYELMRARALKGKVREWLDAADRCLSARDRAGEERMLSEGLRYHPDSPLLLARQVLALTALQRPWEAEESRRRLRAVSRTDTVEKARTVAEAWESLGDSNEAAQAYEQLLARAPDSAEARLSLARLRARRLEYNRAVVEYRRYLKQSPGDGLAWFELGEFQRLNGGNGVEAYAQAERTLQSSDDAWILSLRARIQERLGHFEESRRLWNKAVAKDAGKEMSSDYVQFLLDGDMSAQAESIVSSAGGAQSGNSAVRHAAAQVMLLYDQNLAAEPLLNEVRRARPDDIGVVDDLARAQDANGYWWLALREYDDMARRGPRR